MNMGAGIREANMKDIFSSYIIKETTQHFVEIGQEMSKETRETV
jgi:hypothetical protein